MKKDKKIEGNKKIVALAAALILLIGGTYAWLTITLNGTKTARIEAGTLAMEILDETNAINIENAVPITDQEGRALTPYKFVIENKGTVSSEYSVYLDKQPIITESEFDMPQNRIKCHVTKTIKQKTGAEKAPETDQQVSQKTDTYILSDLDSTKETTTALLDSSSGNGSDALEANQYIEYEVRLWIDQNATTAEMQKEENGVKKLATYGGKLRLEATQVGIEEDQAYAN